ncbi:uncharacterized protein [Apostichopus japonicus]|uniref:uncharacterized protein isoform X2 n=1 Tax=Stichopus japonicus TaxID=307972 RepID=UPI003AB39B48
MLIVRLFRNEARKVVVFKEFRDLIETAKKKFKIAEDVILVDKEDGAEIDEDSLVPLLEMEPNTAIMVLKRGEKWVSPAAARVKIDSNSDTDVISEEDDTQDHVNLPSTSSAPPMKRFRETEATTDEAAELIRAVLQKSASGATVLAEYRAQKCLSEKSRRLLVNIVVANMMEVHGRTPPTVTKRKYAVGIVNLFENLKDPYTPTGHEAFYDDRTNTGFLAARIKNVNRGERRSEQSTITPKDPACKHDGGPMLKRALPAVSDNLQSEDNTTADVNWMKHTPAVSTDSNLVFEKMKNTLLVRRNMVNAMNSAGHIIEEFPQFKITPGLIEQDFRLLFPEEYPKLLEQWPLLKQKVIALARKSTDKGTTAELLATVDRGPCEDLELGSWDKETATILLVLCLLPPANHGRTGVSKLPVIKAVDFLIQFEKSGCSIDAFLENSSAMQPYILALGPTKSSISQYFIVVDHLALPCAAHDALGAFDALFKSHYVFGLHYSKHLLNFWTFLQTTVYGIDINNTHQTPRVRALRSKLQE